MPKEQRKVLLDTNLLVYLYFKKSSKSKILKDLIYRLKKGNVILILTEQSLLEFYSVITDSKRVEKPVSPQIAQKEINKYYQSDFFVIIHPLTTTFEIFLDIIAGREVKRGKIFDFYLAATALSNKIRTIYTEDEKDFRDIKGLKTVNPFN